MQKILASRWPYITIAIIVIVFVLSLIFNIGGNNNSERVTTVVDTGVVRQVVSVSGISEAEQTAQLAFPSTGIVRDVFVEVGDNVNKGDSLVTLDARALYADREDASALLAKAVADRDELLAGPTSLARDVTTENITTKQTALKTVTATENQKISNAYANLLSSNLTAYSNNPNEDAVPPTISGTYTCKTEGTYELNVFSSGSDSGYSYYLSGIEAGTYVASDEQPIALGKCGLRIQFDKTSRYSNTHWLVEIPNTKSAQYTTSHNLYTLTISQAESAIKLAERAVITAKTTATNQNAPARSEAVTRADASITQARARLSRINSTISDRTLIAPFTGTVTEIDILPGETVTSAPVVTLLAGNNFKMNARIPEIDISKLIVGEIVEMLFDASLDEIIFGKITFVSPQETEIDGVSYYKAVIEFDEAPAWMRSGLNADIDIIINNEEDTLRIPKRFLNKTTSGYEVTLLKDNKTSTTTIEVLLEGNNGFVSIKGLKIGDVIVAP